MTITYSPTPAQVQAINWLTNHGRAGAGLALRMGSGKTACVLEAYRRLQAASQTRLRMLIVAPLTVGKLVWRQEAAKWGYPYTISLVMGTAQQRAKALEADANIYIINYDNLQWMTTQYFAGADIIVFDEIHNMKSWKSQRVKVFKKFLPTFKYRWGLTGTISPNGYKDVFAQMYCLDLGKHLGTTMSGFLNTYFHAITDWRVTPPIKASMVPDLKTKIADVFLGTSHNLVESLRTIEHVPLKIKFPPTCMALYKKLEREFIVAIAPQDVKGKEEYVVIPDAVNKGMKLLQFTAGNAYDKDGKTIYIHDLKAEKLKDLVESSQGEKIIVVYQFKHELKSLSKEVPGVIFSADTAEDCIKTWESDEGPQVLYIHPKSAGAGLNLQSKCSIMVFATLGYSLSDWEQTIGRIDRTGQKSAIVTIYYLEIEDTIDTHIREIILSGKAKVQSELIYYLSQHRDFSGPIESINQCS